MKLFPNWPTHLSIHQASRMLLRVDDVVQALRKEPEQNSAPIAPEEMMESWKYSLYDSAL